MLLPIAQMSLLLGAATPHITLREFLYGCDDRLALVEEVKNIDRSYFAALAAYAASDACPLHRSCRSPLFDRLVGLGNRRPVFDHTTRDGGRIKLSVCMDEGVMLIFSGVGTPQAEVYVSSSEDDLQWDRTPLWSAKDARDGT